MSSNRYIVEINNTKFKTTNKKEAFDFIEKEVYKRIIHNLMVHNPNAFYDLPCPINVRCIKKKNGIEEEIYNKAVSIQLYASIDYKDGD